MRIETGAFGDILSREKSMSKIWKVPDMFKKGELFSCRCRLRYGVDDVLSGTHGKHPEIWGCFLDTWDSLLQNLHVRPRPHVVPSSFWGGSQPGGVAVY